MHLRARGTNLFTTTELLVIFHYLTHNTMCMYMCDTMYRHVCTYLVYLHNVHAPNDLAYGEIETCAAYGEIDTCPAYGEIDTCPAYGEIDTCPAYGEIDTCPAYGEIDKFPAYVHAY